LGYYRGINIRKRTKTTGKLLNRGVSEPGGHPQEMRDVARRMDEPLGIRKIPVL